VQHLAAGERVVAALRPVDRGHRRRRQQLKPDSVRGSVAGQVRPLHLAYAQRLLLLSSLTFRSGHLTWGGEACMHAVRSQTTRLLMNVTNFDVGAFTLSARLALLTSLANITGGKTPCLSLSLSLTPWPERGLCRWLVEAHCVSSSSCVQGMRRHRA
jgi:hypothetical protein